MSPMPTSKDVEQLLREAERYLGAVEVFRAEGREPVWRCDAVLCEEPAL